MRGRASTVGAGARRASPPCGRRWPTVAPPWPPGSSRLAPIPTAPRTAVPPPCTSPSTGTARTWSTCSLEPARTRVGSTAPAAAPPTGSARSSPGQLEKQGPTVLLGLKALDLFAPLPRGGLVYWHGSYGLGQMVILGEIATALAPTQISWIGFECDLLDRTEVAHLQAEIGFGDSAFSINLLPVDLAPEDEAPLLEAAVRSLERRALPAPPARRPSGAPRANRRAGGLPAPAAGNPRAGRHNLSLAPVRPRPPARGHPGGLRLLGRPGPGASTAAPLARPGLPSFSGKPVLERPSL